KIKKDYVLSARSERRVYVFGQLNTAKVCRILPRNSEKPSLIPSLPLLDLTGECHLTYSPRTPARAFPFCSGQASTRAPGTRASPWERRPRPPSPPNAQRPCWPAALLVPPSFLPRPRSPPQFRIPPCFLPSG